MKHASILSTIGRTPVVKLNRLAPAHVNIYAKVESFNPMGSVKDRLALAVIEDAERSGALKPGQTVVEATSGNTGIGLAINMQVFAATDFADEMHFEYPLSPPGWTAEARDAILKEPFMHRRGKLMVPSKPGLGFDIDESALEKYGRCFFRATRKSVAWMPEAIKDLSFAPVAFKTSAA